MRCSVFAISDLDFRREFRDSKSVFLERKINRVGAIFLLYLMTVPTNVLVLGAFTEVWLSDFHLQRASITFIYWVSTLLVFIILNIFRQRYCSKKALYFLGVICWLFAFFSEKYIPVLNLFLLFLCFQWIGQGVLVELCRAHLFEQASQKRYTLFAGCLEAMGTLAVFMCPFIFLWLLQKMHWKSLFYLLGAFYLFMGMFWPVFRFEKEFLKLQGVWKEKRFWVANSLLYLPVIISSGIFFHLEKTCACLKIDLSYFCFYTLLQTILGGLLQAAFGGWIRESYKRVRCLLLSLLFSQLSFCFSLFYISTWGKFIYVVTGALGWGCFGILVDVLWKFLYPSDFVHAKRCLQLSVSVGFLANALGPVLFYFLVR